MILELDRKLRVQIYYFINIISENILIFKRQKCPYDGSENICVNEIVENVQSKNKITKYPKMTTSYTAIIIIKPNISRKQNTVFYINICIKMYLFTENLFTDLHHFAFLL